MLIVHRILLSDDSDEEEDTSDRTLFAVNIPINYEYTDVMTLFSCFGAVSSVVFQGDAKKIGTRIILLVICMDVCVDAGQMSISEYVWGACVTHTWLQLFVIAWRKRAL